MELESKWEMEMERNGPELGRKGANNGYTPMFFFFSEILTVIDGGEIGWNMLKSG